jgi:hypothetical protein
MPPVAAAFPAGLTSPRTIDVAKIWFPKLKARNVNRRVPCVGLRQAPISLHRRRFGFIYVNLASQHRQLGDRNAITGSETIENLDSM